MINLPGICVCHCTQYSDKSNKRKKRSSVFPSNVRAIPIHLDEQFNRFNTLQFCTDESFHFNFLPEFHPSAGCNNHGIQFTRAKFFFPICTLWLSFRATTIVGTNRIHILLSKKCFSGSKISCKYFVRAYAVKYIEWVCIQHNEFRCNVYVFWNITTCIYYCFLRTRIRNCLYTSSSLCSVSLFIHKRHTRTTLNIKPI